MKYEKIFSRLHRHPPLLVSVSVLASLEDWEWVRTDHHCYGRPASAARGERGAGAASMQKGEF